MTDPLSILDAARDARGATALRHGGRSHTFGELADLVRTRIDTLDRSRNSRTPYALVAANTLETLATLYALLEARVPALLLHPRLTALERDALRERARRLGSIAHDDAAAVLFTSGTTGEPRAAVLTRGALLASAQASAANLGWRNDDCWLACMTIAHVGGLSIVTRCLAARRALALVDRFDAAQFPRWVSEERVTLASLVPTMLERVLDTHVHWKPPAHLRAVLIGGAAASARLLARAAARAVPVLATYGLTETCSQVTTVRYAERYEGLDSGAGEALPGAQVRVVDGRIHVRGAMLMAGYWGEPPLAPGAWFDTGDLGEIDARGCLHVLGRRADLIVTGGENVYPAEVERVLETLPGIAAAAVFGVPDDSWGATVAAALVADGAPPSDAALVSQLGSRLAPHKRPRLVCFVEQLPHTRGGKLDRCALGAFAASLRTLAMRP